MFQCFDLTPELVYVNADGSKDLKLIDAPVSGGVIRAADGTLTV